jgi:hypothetical protein
LKQIKDAQELEKSLLGPGPVPVQNTTKFAPSKSFASLHSAPLSRSSTAGGSQKRHRKKPSSSYINLHKSRKHIEKFIKYTKKLNLNTNIPKIAKNVTPKRLNAIKNKLYKSFKQELFKK